MAGSVSPPHLSAFLVLRSNASAVQQPSFATKVRMAGFSEQKSSLEISHQLAVDIN
jgi:hypothetical protein